MRCKGTKKFRENKDETRYFNIFRAFQRFCILFFVLVMEDVYLCTIVFY